MPYPSYYEYITSEYREAADRYVFMLQHIGLNPFEELLKCCQDVVRGITRKYYLEGYETGDLEQEARMILVKSLKNYKLDENLSFMQYFHLCLQNHLNKTLRKQQAIKRRATHDAYSLEQMSEHTKVPYDYFMPKQVEEPCALYCARESYEHYIEELSMIEKKVFQCFISGMESDEICQKLEIEFQMMKRALYRCSAKLRKKVRENKKEANL